MNRPQLFDQPSFIPIFENYSYFNNKIIGLTGHRGVLGRIMCKRLSSNGLKTDAFPGDITDAQNLGTWFNEHNFDYFFHFAAVVPTKEVAKYPLKAFKTNVIGTYNICKQIIKTQTDCWLFLASSSHVYKPTGIKEGQQLMVGSIEEPQTFYGKSKLASELITRPVLEKHNIDYCIGRIFSFSSSIQKEPYLAPTLKRKIKELKDNDVLAIINPDSVRDIMDAETVVDCVLHLAQKRFNGTINIGAGRGMNIKEIAHQVAKSLKKTIQVQGINKNKPDSLVADVNDLKQLFQN